VITTGFTSKAVAGAVGGAIIGGTINGTLQALCGLSDFWSAFIAGAIAGGLAGYQAGASGSGSSDLSASRKAIERRALGTIIKSSDFICGRVATDLDDVIFRKVLDAIIPNELLLQAKFLQGLPGQEVCKTLWYNAV
jgi:uncharacterized protein YcfJ